MLGAAENATLPPPFPDAPDVIVSHDAFGVAVHMHPLDVVTVTGDPAPPAAAIDWLVGKTVKLHVDGS